MTPWPIRAPPGLSTAFKKLLGIPVVRFMRGLLSNSRSLFVGQSWIQWPHTQGQTRARPLGASTGHTFLSTTVAHIARRERLIGLLVMRRKWLASASAGTRSTWIGVNPGLTEREGKKEGKTASDRTDSECVLENLLRDTGRTAKGDTNCDIFS